MIKCRHCGKECKNANSEAQHQRHCKHNPEKIDISGENHPNYGKKLKRKPSVISTCSFCQRTCTSQTSRLQHEKYCNENPDRIVHKMHDVWDRRKKGELEYPATPVRSPMGAEEWELWRSNISKAVREFYDSDRGAQAKAKISKKNKGRKHSEETKQKLSESQVEFLKSNPDRHPYVLYHSSKPNPAEDYWRACLIEEGILCEEQHRVGLWVLDFAWPSHKVNLEIDGEWHYTDDSCIEKDKRRDKELTDSGWEIIRVRWSKFMSLDRIGREREVKRIAGKIKKLMV